MNNKTFQNKVIWITGASSGIGRALAVELAQRFKIKLILSSRSKSALEQLSEELPLAKADIFIQPLDLSDNANFENYTSRLITHFGNIDIVIHCGGISQRANFHKLKDEYFRQIMEVNFFGTVALTRAILPFMLERKQGDFIAISSVQGKFGIPERTAYAASKHALQGFFDSLRAEYNKDGIGVLLVCPGYVKTNLSINAVTANGIPQGKKENRQAISAKKCAEIIINGYQKGKLEIYPSGIKEKVAVWLKRLFPKQLASIVKAK